MILNGPATYKQLNSKNWEDGFPELLKYKNKDCKVCEAEGLTECMCLGSNFQLPEFEFDYENDLPKDVKI